MPMSMKEAMYWSSTAWRGQGDVDPELAEEFAKILFESVNEAISSERIKDARRIMWDSFREDDDFRRSYLNNIQVLIADFLDSTKTELRSLSESILDFLFNPHDDEPPHLYEPPPADVVCLGKNVSVEFTY